MTKFRNFTDYLQKNKWIFAAFLYIILCLWLYLTAYVEIEGIALPQHDAGIIALIGWHAMLLLAFAGAWILHKIVDLISKLRRK